MWEREKLVTDPLHSPSKPRPPLVLGAPTPPTHLVQAFLPWPGPSLLSMHLPGSLASPSLAPLTPPAAIPFLSPYSEHWSSWLTASPPVSLQPTQAPIPGHETVLGQEAFSSLI